MKRMVETANIDQLEKDRNYKRSEKEPQRFYRILFLEDNPDDVELMQHELSESNFQFASQRTDKKNEFLKLVSEFQPDVILADYSLSSFNGLEAFHMLRKEKMVVPFILVTGVLSEQLALECLKEGIDDFVLKSSFKRLPSAILNAIKKKEVEQEKNRMSLELEKSHKELKLLLNRHQQLVEEERTKISRDLHDELGQALTALKIDVSMFWKKFISNKNLSQGTIHDEFASIIKLIDQITLSVKTISSGLRPETLDALGIVVAIRWQAIEFEKRNKIVCKTHLPMDHLDLGKDLSIAIFRIVQEALTNVARHSSATEVEIQLEVVDSLISLKIIDNGKGIDEEQVLSSKSLGIIGLRERVHLLKGQFDIRSGPEGGTYVLVIIPIL
jgi:signal transduction histidine kinase